MGNEDSVNIQKNPLHYFVPHSNSQGYCTGRQEYAENLYLWVGVFCAARVLILSDNCHWLLPYITELQMWVTG